ncbi:elongation factor P 5-aminopentanone reductase [Sutcliffiella halmapala]|uniref:elongation factor P 5-aminopentanone reductase n=1 Tax=Sutcliffiella halmapala TaxID=79882 RepID=UPI001474CDCE|nr:SDR family oxidoreductase [Sutcliffiella halmapala]
MKKTALIIGASGDIGKAIAMNLSKEGYYTYLHYNRDHQAIHDLQKNLGTENTEVLQADLSQPGSVEILANGIAGAVDTIVYNAGASYYGLMTDINEETKNRMIQLNITSLYSTIQSFLPRMIKSRSGNIVVISSIWGQVGASCEVLYSMTKGAQISFVKALAKEVAPSGIRVNAIAPGAVNTKMLHHFSEDDMLQICEEIPMGRLANPQEIADSVSFLISNKSSYTTGQTLGINGGWN